MDLTLFIDPEHAPDDDLARRPAEHVEPVSAAHRLGYDAIATGTTCRTDGPSVVRELGR